MPASYRKLVDTARKARLRAHAPFSRFRVGAALLGFSGRIYRGCNVENSSYGLTICAERTAMFTAITEGERKFKAIAIVADDPDFTPPCGACRQVLSDLAGNIDVIMVNSRGDMTIVKLYDLLPYAFDGKHLAKAKRTK